MFPKKLNPSKEMDNATAEEKEGAKNVQTIIDDDKYVPGRIVELELNLHQIMELTGTFAVVINSIVEEPVNTCVGLTDVNDRDSLSTIYVAPDEELGSPLEPTSVRKTDDELLMRGLTQTATVSDIETTTDCCPPKLQ